MVTRVCMVCMYVGVHSCVSPSVLHVCIMHVFVVGAYVLISLGQAADQFKNHYPDLRVLQ